LKSQIGSHLWKTLAMMAIRINTAWETTRENIKISVKKSLACYELKKHKPLFDEGYSKLLDKMKQALQDPSEQTLNKFKT
jgi:hypothetical protein